MKDHANRLKNPLLEWINSYNASTKRKTKYFDNNSLILVKFFISSNLSLVALRNPHLLKLMKIPIPCDQTFTRKILPEILLNLKTAIDFKLQNATCVSLTSDIWTTKSLLDFLAICVNLSDSNFSRETIVIGMIRMPGNHNAEHIKTAFENIVNSFEFDKSKISATVSDEGSAYLRLFKQIGEPTNANMSYFQENFLDQGPELEGFEHFNYYKSFSLKYTWKTWF